jgi:protein-L-isoaspartate(D-aspartate) O-methyltransferase
MNKAAGIDDQPVFWLQSSTSDSTESSTSSVELLRRLAFRLLLVFASLVSSMSATKSQPTAEATFSAQRQQMVEEQLASPGRNIRNRRVLDAMASVPRHEFVPENLRRFSYWDEPLPIGHGQTISQPFIVAFMTEQLDPKPTDRVLEIGTGSGYQAAVLSHLVAEVFSIEIIEPLARQAEAVLSRLGYNNVKVLAADGYLGWPEHAPFDAVIVTCAPDHIPQPLVEQLRDGGRMIIPVGPVENQELYLLQKKGSKVEQEAVLPVRFVPMKRKRAF